MDRGIGSYLVTKIWVFVEQFENLSQRLAVVWETGSRSLRVAHLLIKYTKTSHKGGVQNQIFRAVSIDSKV